MTGIEFAGLRTSMERMHPFQKGLEHILRLSRRHEQLVETCWRSLPFGVRRLVVQQAFCELDQVLQLDSDPQRYRLMGIAYSTNQTGLRELRREVGQYRLAARFTE